MTLAVAANPLGQMIFSPLIGWWSNKLGSSRLPMLITLAIFTFASGFYSILEILPIESRKMAMLVSRFLVGVSSGNCIYQNLLSKILLLTLFWKYFSPHFSIIQIYLKKYITIGVTT